MSTYWFRPKRYGYGAVPVTWQGWTITVATAIVVGVSSALVPIFAALMPWIFAVIPIDLLLIVALVIVSRCKTDGGWRWRWGK
jgi:hypothetical protein